MKEIGIVRSIDELGRIVIPKEIRRTMRIREGDQIEIYTDRDGGIILKKFSPISEFASFALDFTEALSSTLGLTIIICDKDIVIASSGEHSGEYFGRPISTALEDSINSCIAVKKEGSNTIPLVNGKDSTLITSQIITPILMDGLPIGAVVLLSHKDVVMGEAEMKTAKSVVAFFRCMIEQ